jgi:hypothetical protein
VTVTQPEQATGAVFRIEWRPGTDRLLGTCHCGASREQEDPVLMWDWLLAHPAHDLAERSGD